MIKLIFLLLFCVVLGEEKLFLQKKGQKFLLSENTPGRGIDGFLEIRKDIYGVTVKPYVNVKIHKIPNCEYEEPAGISPQLYNTLVELAKKRFERRRLLDQKLRTVLTDEVIKRLNALERRYNLNYDYPISRSIDAFELYNRIAVLVAVMAH